MDMSKKTAIIVGIGTLTALGAFAQVWFFSYAGPGSTSVIVRSEPSADTSYASASLVKQYVSEAYRFSVSIPEDFNAQDLPLGEDGAHTIVLQNAKGDGIQILVTPYPSDIKTLTADDVRASIPDMKVTDEQVVNIGSDYQGVAFKTDNDAFGGASREVWFYYPRFTPSGLEGQLYQISTYARLDSLLKQMFATWKFF